MRSLLFWKEPGRPQAATATQAESLKETPRRLQGARVEELKSVSNPPYRVNNRTTSSSQKPGAPDPFPLLTARSGGFQVRIPASFLKNPSISPRAKLLRAILAAYADARTGETYVKPATLGKLLRCSRGKREAAQRELVSLGWLKLKFLRGARGRWGRRIFVLTEPTASPLLVFTAAVAHR